MLVTGSTGFIGRPLCRSLVEAGAIVRGASRKGGIHPVHGVQRVHIPDPLDRRAVRAAAVGADAVVHLAARVHVMSETAADPLTEFRQANADATEVLAAEAAAAGVRTMVLASSVKAVGEQNSAPWTEEVPAAPTDPYGISKRDAERALASMASRFRDGATVLRLPLVYGPGMQGNMLRLFTLVYRRLPLPFASVANRRSMLFVENLVAAVRRMLERPSPGIDTYFVTDGRDLSLPELLTMIGTALGRPARVLAVPPHWLKLALPEGVAERLLGSLTVSSAKLARTTGYQPPWSVEAGLAATAAWYLGSRRKASA